MIGRRTDRGHDPKTLREAMGRLFGGVPDAAAIVIDRANEQRGDEVTQVFGGGWRAGYELWRGLKLPYLLLIAYSPERIETRNPLSMMAADLPHLKFIAQAACDHLDDVQCGWMRMLAPEADKIVTAIVLADATAAGTATA